MCSSSSVYSACVGVGNTLVAFTTKQEVVSSSFKWMPKWSEREGLFEVNIYCIWGNVHYYKSVHHPIPTLPVGIRNTQENKSVNSTLFNRVSRYILLLSKLKGKERPFLEGCKGNPFVRLSPRALGCYKRLKSLSFCEIWNNPTPPLLFIRPP